VEQQLLRRRAGASEDTEKYDPTVYMPETTVSAFNAMSRARVCQVCGCNLLLPTILTHFRLHFFMSVRGVIYFSCWIDTLFSSAPGPSGGHDGLSLVLQEVCVSCPDDVTKMWQTSRICVHGSFHDQGGEVSAMCTTLAAKLKSPHGDFPLKISVDHAM
jgi:hypothetical protein